MRSTFPPKRRGSLSISVAILKAARHGARQAILIKSVSLSYGQFTRYITLLKACGFISENGTFYQTTEKGKKLVKEFESSTLIRSVLVA
jgi:predicted transcriptional regulator